MSLTYSILLVTPLLTHPVNLQGMQYLYENGVQHRDLKAKNCLVVEQKSGDFHVKLADFGLSKSKKLVASFTRRSSQHAGTVTHMAPEVLLNGSDELFCEESDVYSYGIVMWEVLSRAVPFEGLNRAQIIAQISQNLRPSPILTDSPPEMIGLMEECWAQDTFPRPTFADIVETLSDLQEDALPEEARWPLYRLPLFFFVHFFSPCLCDRHVPYPLALAVIPSNHSGPGGGGAIA